MSNQNKIVVGEISLAFNDLAQGGTSDKVYHLQIIRDDAMPSLHRVVSQYGRRGGTLAIDDKTKSGPVVIEQARKIFERVVHEKLGKGYTRTDTTAPAPQIEPPSAPAPSNNNGNGNTAPPPAREHHAQELLEEIQTEDAMLRLIADENYWMQDKSDGQSRGAVKTATGEIYGLNKTGGRVPLPAEIVAELNQIPLRSFQIDAEILGTLGAGQQLIARDILTADRDIRTLTYTERFCLLVGVLSPDFKHIRAVETWAGTANKHAALKRSREQCREGVVFKLITAPHRAGRNGQHKKFKFIKTASVIAGKPRATGKDSVEIFLIDGTGKPTNSRRTFPNVPCVRVGTVSLIGKPQIREGDVLEVAYLYAFPSKMLAQARLQRIRDDVKQAECTTAQLIYKREEAA